MATNTIDIEALKAQIKAELEAEYAAKREVAEKKAQKFSPEVQEQLARMEERVPVELFKDGKEYRDDVFVAVNGENCVIKRGQTVWVKRKFAEVLDNSRKQQTAANEYALQKQQEFAEETKKYF